MRLGKLDPPAPNVSVTFLRPGDSVATAIDGLVFNRAVGMTSVIIRAEAGKDPSKELLPRSAIVATLTAEGSALCATTRRLAVRECP